MTDAVTADVLLKRLERATAELDPPFAVVDLDAFWRNAADMERRTAGKPIRRKDLALMAMAYGTVYVANVAMGAGDMHTVKAFLEAEAYNGPSLILAYSHCIAHGFDLAYGMDQQKAAVASGYWPLFRYNPELAAQNKNPFQLDSRAPSIPLKNFIYNETRYTMLGKSNPEHAKVLLQEAEVDVAKSWKLYDYMAHQPANGGEKQ